MSRQCSSVMSEVYLQDVYWFHSMNAQSRLETYFDNFIIITTPLKNSKESCSIPRRDQERYLCRETSGRQERKLNVWDLQIEALGSFVDVEKWIRPGSMRPSTLEPIGSLTGWPKLPQHNQPGIDAAAQSGTQGCM